jgi:uncharacterized protein (DUF1015 family)
MATIGAFRGLRPNPSELHPSAFLGEEVGAGMELDYLKFRLEPAKGAGQPKLSDCRDFLQLLVKNNSYLQESEPSIYIYESVTDGVFRTGVWALTSLDDVIIPHEDTLAAAQEELVEYRNEVGLEASAVLFTYKPNAGVDELVAMAKASQQGFSYAYQGIYHKFWCVDDASLIAAFIEAFSHIGPVYMADGHHRYGAAGRLHERKPQWISSLYLPSSEIEVRPFHRVLRLEEGFNVPKALETVASYYYISLAPDFKAYRPKQKNTMGMCLNGTWYRLDLRESSNFEGIADACFLQANILAPAFGVKCPRTDKRLSSFSDENWRKLLLELAKEGHTIAFTLFGISTSELLELAERGIIMPPKSTYICPKVPYGLLMHASSSFVGGEAR